MDDDSSMTGQSGSSRLSQLVLDIDVDYPLSDISHVEALVQTAVANALDAALTGPPFPAELYVKLVGNAESQTLNAQYRDKDYPTNVLSFPGTEPEDLSPSMQFALTGGPPVMLGDLIIASDVVVKESAAQNKEISHHFTHLVVHGVLHLLGHDHIEDAQAEEMEELEKEILKGMGISNPYRET